MNEVVVSRPMEHVKVLNSRLIIGSFSFFFSSFLFCVTGSPPRTNDDDIGSRSYYVFTARNFAADR